MELTRKLIKDLRLKLLNFHTPPCIDHDYIPLINERLFEILNILEMQQAALEYAQADLQEMKRAK